MSIIYTLIIIHYTIAILFGPVIVKLYNKKTWDDLINCSKLEYDREQTIVKFISIIMFWEFCIFVALFIKIVKLYFKYHPSFKEK